MELLQLINESVYDDVHDAVAALNGECMMDIDVFGELSLVCHWRDKRSWRLVVKRYHSFHRMEGWVDLATAEKMVIQAEINHERPVVAIVFPDGCVEFYSVTSAKKIKT